MATKDLTNDDLANLIIDMSNKRKTATDDRTVELCDNYVDGLITELLNRGIKEYEIIPLLIKVSDINEANLNEH